MRCVVYLFYVLSIIKITLLVYIDNKIGKLYLILNEPNKTKKKNNEEEEEDDERVYDTIMWVGWNISSPGMSLLKSIIQNHESIEVSKFI